MRIADLVWFLIYTEVWDPLFKSIHSLPSLLFPLQSKQPYPSPIPHLPVSHPPASPFSHIVRAGFLGVWSTQSHRTPCLIQYSAVTAEAYSFWTRSPVFLFVLVSLCTNYVVGPVYNNILRICPLLSFSIAWSKPLTSLQDDSCLVSLLPLRLPPITPPHAAARIILLGHRNDVALNLLLNVSLFSPTPYLA